MNKDSWKKSGKILEWEVRILHEADFTRKWPKWAAV